jgi:hypothetical protein
MVFGPASRWALNAFDTPPAIVPKLWPETGLSRNC